MPAREWDDLGNAERVIDRYGSEVRWLADIERWTYYDGCMREKGPGATDK